MTPLAYAWTAVASSAPVATSTMTARPDSVPKSMPIVTLIGRGLLAAVPSSPRRVVGARRRPGRLPVIRGRPVLAVEMPGQQLAGRARRSWRR